MCCTIRVKKRDRYIILTRRKDDEHMIIPESALNNLTDEQKKKIETAKTPEEFLAIARETGYELSEEQLNAISGGWCATDCRDYVCYVWCPRV